MGWLFVRAAGAPSGRFADFLRAMHVTFLHREYLSRARTRVFAALGLWTATAQVECFASCRAMAAALVADGCV